MFFLRRRKFKISTVVALAAALMLVATELLAGGHDKDFGVSIATTHVDASNGIIREADSVITPN